MHTHRAATDERPEPREESHETLERDHGTGGEGAGAGGGAPQAQAPRAREREKLPEEQRKNTSFEVGPLNLNISAPL